MPLIGKLLLDGGGPGAFTPCLRQAFCKGAETPSLSDFGLSNNGEDLNLRIIVPLPGRFDSRGQGKPKTLTELKSPPKGLGKMRQPCRISGRGLAEATINRILDLISPGDQRNIDSILAGAPCDCSCNLWPALLIGSSEILFVRSNMGPGTRHAPTMLQHRLSRDFKLHTQRCLRVKEVEPGLNLSTSDKLLEHWGQDQQNGM